MQYIGHPKPQKLAEMNFEISVAGAVTRHGVINSEEFGRNFGGSFCAANEARKCPEHFVQNFAQFFAQLFAQDFARSKKFVAAISLWGMSGVKYTLLVVPPIACHLQIPNQYSSQFERHDLHSTGCCHALAFSSSDFNLGLLDGVSIQVQDVPRKLGK